MKNTNTFFSFRLNTILYSFLAILLSCNFAFTQNTNNCPDNLAGYSLLGEYENHKYFLSNNIYTWTEAQTAAQAQGGYLLSINDAAEHEFITELLNEIVFIGLNDADEDGVYIWDSGETITYQNPQNLPPALFAHMNFWDDQWGYDGMWTSRKAIMEIPCAEEVDPCSFSLTGNINCSEYLPNGNFKIVMENNNLLTEYIMDNSGQIIAQQELGLAATQTLNIESNSIVKRDVDENIIYEQAIPASIVDAYFSLDKVIAFETGYIIAAYKYEGLAYDDERELTLIKTDQNINVLATHPIPTQGGYESFVHSLAKINETRFAIVFNETDYGAGYNKADILIVDENLIIKSRKTITGYGQTDEVPDNVNLKQTACGTWYMLRNGGWENCNNGCYEFFTDSYWVFENDEMVLLKQNSINSGSTTFHSQPAISYIEHSFSAPDPNGGTVKAHYHNSGYVFDPNNNVWVLISNYNFEHLDTQENQTWYHSEQSLPSDFRTFLDMPIINGNYFLVTKPEDNLITVLKLDCFIETPQGSCSEDIEAFSFIGSYNDHNYFLSDEPKTWLEAQLFSEENGGYLVSFADAAENEFVTGLINEIVFIGFDDDNGDNVYQWASGENNSYTNFQASPNEAFTSMNFWNGKWATDGMWTQRRFILELPCNTNTQNRESKNSTEQNPEISSSKNKIYPNPASQEISVVIFNKKRATTIAYIIDLDGKIVKQQAVELLEGENTISFSLLDIKPGLYQLYFPQEEETQSFRFVKM